KVKGINIEGKFKLEIRHASGGSRNAQITVDNITWTSYDGSTEKKNLLENGDFEEWENGLPVGWFGAKSNIAKSKVNKTNTGAKDGDYAVQLAETGSSHKRFTSKPISIKKDIEYILTYWVKGKGEIRNAFFRDGGYSQYTDYTILDTDEWQEITYTFSYDKDVDDVEVIFSVRNADEEKGYIQVDDALLVSDEDEVEEPINKVSNVIARPKEGTVDKGTEVILETETKGATIYYTIDGSEPTVESSKYVEPIIRNENTTIKAIAVKEGMENSDIGIFV